MQDGFSTEKIIGYLRRYCQWWMRTVESCNYAELLQWFINVCWDEAVAAIARHVLDIVNLNYKPLLAPATAST